MNDDEILLIKGQEVADLLRPFAASGLTRYDKIDPAFAERLRKRLQLRGLSNPLPAFEGDEASAFAHAIPMSCRKPIHARPKKPACPTASPATSGIT